MSRNKNLGSNFEKRVVQKAQDIGLEARLQPGSGVFKDFPHDAVIEDFLVECKVRTVQVDGKGRRIFPLDLNWLKSVEGDAEKGGYCSAIVVFNATNERKPHVVLSYDAFLFLLSQAKKGSL